MKQNTIFKIYLFALSLLALDRLIKWLAQKWLSESAAEGFFVVRQFGLQLFKNEKFVGVVSLPALLGAALMAIFLCLLLALLRKEALDGKRVETIALSLALAGALSNAGDRAFYGYVIDYLVIGPAVINLSDILVAAGIMIYLKQKN